jgi:hypothetical protein
MNIFWALIGVLLLSIGGLWSTNFWERYSKAEIRSRKIKFAAILLLILIFLILPGAFLSSYFWNDYFHKLNRNTHRQEIIRLLASEIVVNYEIFRNNKFHDQDDDNMSTFVVYPRFQKTALESAIGSGLFFSDNEKELLTNIYHIYERISEINNRLGLTESQMISNPQPSNIALWRKRIRDGGMLASLKPLMTRMSKLLIDDYGIQEDDTFFIELEY